MNSININQFKNAIISSHSTLVDNINTRLYYDFKDEESAFTVLGVWCGLCMHLTISEFKEILNVLDARDAPIAGILYGIGHSINSLVGKYARTQFMKVANGLGLELSQQLDLYYGCLLVWTCYKKDND